MIRNFSKEIISGREHCKACGLIEEKCICNDSVELMSNLRFILLTHENEFSRRTNTGRLIENLMYDTLVIKWSRVDPSKELLDIIENGIVFLLYPEISDEEKMESLSLKHKLNEVDKINIIIIDGTWQESAKIYNRSPYLHKLKKISLERDVKSDYKLRRKKEAHQLCTVEAAIEVFKIFDEYNNSNLLSEYFNLFQNNYR